MLVIGHQILRVILIDRRAIVRGAAVGLRIEDTNAAHAPLRRGLALGWRTKLNPARKIPQFLQSHGSDIRRKGVELGCELRKLLGERRGFFGGQLAEQVRGEDLGHRTDLEERILGELLPRVRWHAITRQAIRKKQRRFAAERNADLYPNRGPLSSCD